MRRASLHCHHPHFICSHNMVKMLCVKTTRFSTSGTQSSHGQGKKKAQWRSKEDLLLCGCMESLRENMVRVLRTVGIPGNTYLKRMRTLLNQEICLQQHPLPMWQIPSSDLPASKSVSTFICTNSAGSCPNVIMWPTTSSLKEAHSMLKTSQVHTVVPDFWCPFQIMLQQCITKYSPGQNSRMRKLRGLLLVIRDNDTILSKNNWPPYHVKKHKQDAS